MFERKRTVRMTAAIAFAGLAGAGTVYMFVPRSAEATPTWEDAVDRVLDRVMVTPTPTAKPSATVPSWLRECLNEDGPGPCRWDAKVSGNGVGHSFWIDCAQFTHYDSAADQKRWGAEMNTGARPYKSTCSEDMRQWHDARRAAGWKYFGTYDGHKACYALIGDTTIFECADGYNTTS